MLTFSLAVQDLPVKLDDESLARLLGQLQLNTDVENIELVSLALVHSSFINEHKADFEAKGVTNKWLYLLDEIGGRYSNLSLYHLGYQDASHITPKQIDNYVQMRKPLVAETLAYELSLSRLAFLGKGYAREHSEGVTRSNLASVLGSQFIGALALVYGYGSVLNVVREQVSRMQIGDIDVRTKLQEYVQRKENVTPIYEILSEDGPEHDKSFQARVSGGRNRSALGSGKSKKRAFQYAANNYVKKYGVSLPVTVEGKRRSDNSAIFSRLPSAFARRVSEIAQNFEASENLATTALIHPSYVNEVTFDCQDNQLLSQFGAKILEAATTHEVAARALQLRLFSHANLNFVAIAAAICNDNSVADLFDEMELQNAVLRAKGFPVITTSAKANVVQALTAAAFVEKSQFQDVGNAVPSPIFRWLSSQIDDKFAIPEGSQDATGKLQEHLQALQLDFEYEYGFSGPQHNATVETVVVLSSAVLNRKIRIGFGIGRSKKEARNSLATVLSRGLEELHSRTNPQLKLAGLDSQAFENVAKLILEQEFTIPPTDVARIRRWGTYGFLGTQFLADRDLLSFSEWITFVAGILNVRAEELLSAQQSRKFYTLYREWLINAPAFSPTLATAFSELGQFVKGLSPELMDFDVRKSPEFEKLLSLARVTRILSSDRTSYGLGEALGDFLLLRHKRKPLIELKSELPYVHVIGYKNLYAEVLTDLMNLLETFPEVREEALGLTVEHLQGSDVVVTFLIPSVVPGDVIESLSHRVETNLFWSFAKAELNLDTFRINKDGLSFHSSPLIIDPKRADIADQVLLLSRRSELEQVEYDTLASTLHDLKNELIAFQLAQDSSDSPQMLYKAKYDASQHLASANSICAVVTTIGRATSVPVIDEVDVGEFFRLYVSEKMTSLPKNIRLVPPRTLETCRCFTSRIFLRSIIENLVKNASEALPDGGEIKIDWVYLKNDKHLVVEVEDTGVGIEQESLQRLLGGESLESIKQGGSGIGMLTVRSMLRRIGAEISGRSELGKGTCWTLQIPDLREELQVDEVTETE